MPSEVIRPSAELRSVRVVRPAPPGRAGDAADQERGDNPADRCQAIEDAVVLADRLAGATTSVPRSASTNRSDYRARKRS
jgi:hypothetical protein